MASTPMATATLVARLAELGYVEGRNLVVDFRYAEAEPQLQAIALDLVQAGVGVIVAPNPYSLRAARAATQSEPLRPRAAPSVSRDAEIPARWTRVRPEPAAPGEGLHQVTVGGDVERGDADLCCH